MRPHKHRFGTIGHVEAFDDPRVLRACQVDTCAETEVVCVLCEEKGDRRSHGGHMGSGDSAVLDRIEELKLRSYFANITLDEALRAERGAARRPTKR